MILRRPSDTPEASGVRGAEKRGIGSVDAGVEDAGQGLEIGPVGGQASSVDPWGYATGWETRAPLRWRLSLTTGLVVALVVAVLTVATYWAVSALLTASVDQQLDRQASSFLTETEGLSDKDKIEEAISEFKAYNPLSQVSLTPADWYFSYGDSIPLRATLDSASSDAATDIRTVGDERIITQRGHDGATVVIAKDMSETKNIIATLGSVLVVVAASGILLAILAGMLVSKAGLRPITRLQRAADYVTQTNDLRPIMVVGTDEMAQLTVSFNAMLAALQETRIQQSQFVADAGHELKTPLTSMRTNIELLMMLNKQGENAHISEQDRKDLENDVLAQMEELSTLIGDLVDLAREDASEKKHERVELHEVIENSLERAKRRRPDVDFKVHIEPWIMQGDQFSLGRATLNLMDNAAKWSPASGTVRVSLKMLSSSQVRLLVDDSGPGIPVEDRERVFERFYRSAEARSMPGSGLGLSIVRQVVERHEGSIRVKESSDGGTRMEVIFPGERGEGEIYEDPGFDHPDSGNSRKEIFAERWFNQL